MFSNKSKVADTKWKIEMFRQDKKHIANFMIEFKVLAMKAETNNLHVIFLLKKNVQIDIIKTILEYSLMAALKMLREWKVAITSVGQGYESMESRQDYRIVRIVNNRLYFISPFSIFYLFSIYFCFSFI